MRWSIVCCWCFAIALFSVGCRVGKQVPVEPQPPLAAAPAGDNVKQVLHQTDQAEQPQGEQSTEEQTELLRLPPSIATAEQVPTPAPLETPGLNVLADSVRRHFPLIQTALASRAIASGEVLAARGAFDHKLEGDGNSQPLDFYENYRYSLGLKRDTYLGGQVFAGYRIGRGEFEPWYLERETNDGGEFKAGFVVPLARDRNIDANRAELWRSQLERGRVEPEIRAMIIGAIRDATVAYWQWVASAANYRVARDVLQLGRDRMDYLERQVELGDKADIELVDNQRIILSRSAKATDARRKLEQATVKLSLFLRDDFGQPIVLPIEAARLVFPQALPASAWGAAAEVGLAQANRPELEELQLARRQLAVLLRQACNETLPEIDAGLLIAQDVGAPTSSLRDKSEFELEASMRLSVPLERRKALGKARQLRGKIAQLRAKTRFAADKIALESQIAHAALVAAAERVVQTTEGLELAEQMQTAEQRLYELGQSTLFNLNLREQQTVEAAIGRVGALFDYHVALADYTAALGFESAAEILPVSDSQVENEAAEDAAVEEENQPLP